MKALKREFDVKQRIILLLLLALLLVLCYIQFVDKPLSAQRTVVKNEIAQAEDDRDFAETKLMNLASMQQRLDDLKNLDNLSYMPSYNASEEELDILNDVLSTAKHYSISFSDVTRSGDQVRRNFTISFSVSQYKDAVGILSKLNESKDRCMVSAVACSSNVNEISQDHLINVSATATFYETMEGGEEDSGLTQEQQQIEESTEEQ